MKYMTNLFWILTTLSMFTLMANRSGRGSLAGEALTLAPGEGGRTCSNAGCHGSASPFGTNVSVTLLDLAGNSVSTYEPGESYRVNLNISANGASGYGFMIVCLDENDQAVNNWGTPPSQIRNVNLFGRDYLEHTTRLESSSFDFDWTAPDSGSGEVTFYAAGNAVNGNNSNSGDDANTTSSTFAESVMSSVDDEKREVVQIFPNPVKDQLTVISTDDYAVELINMLGKPVIKQSWLGQTHNMIDMGSLSPGSYLVRITDKSNNLVQIKRIVKVD